MGKTEDEGNLIYDDDSTERKTRCGYCESIWGFVGFKCFFVFLLSISLFISALFWLPPFHYAMDSEDSNLDPRFRGHVIVASFNIKRPVSFINENILLLENDIFQEMSYISIKVTILAIEQSDEPNTTKVVFGIDHDAEYREILPLSLSSIKEMFESLLINQSTLQLTKSLFGETFLFEALKFPGGITVVPKQSGFLMQKVEILFNFTLNFSIHQIQINFNALTSQLKNGLNLAPYENLYVQLSNSDGSTVSPPTIVHSSVFLSVGTSSPRLKQLTETITGSHSKNLGLNNTIFGKVKQVRLSSFLPNSTKAPAPSPLPSSNHHHHHHRHHHHHHHHHQHHHHHHHHLTHHLCPHRAPTVSPPPQRSPRKAQFAPPPRVHVKEKHLPRAPEPARSPYRSPSYPARPPYRSPSYLARPPYRSPSYPARPAYRSPSYPARPPYHQLHSLSPIPAAKPHIVPTSAPLPHVVFAHVAQPSKSQSSEQHTDQVPHPQPLSSSSNAGLPALPWTVLLILIAVRLHI